MLVKLKAQLQRQREEQQIARATNAKINEAIDRREQVEIDSKVNRLAYEILTTCGVREKNQNDPQIMAAAESIRKALKPLAAATMMLRGKAKIPFPDREKMLANQIVALAPLITNLQAQVASWKEQHPEEI